MESTLWHAFGTVSALAFTFAIALTILARYWFRSKDAESVKRGATILAAPGGAENARDAQAEMLRRNVV